MSHTFHLREQVERCRRLARDSTDDTVSDGLLKLAEEYSARADAEEDRMTTGLQARAADDRAR
jgi:hypothetical protein